MAGRRILLLTVVAVTSNVLLAQRQNENVCLDRIADSDHKWIQSGLVATFVCGNSGNFKWWRSKECKFSSFTEHSRCSDPQCTVTAEDYDSGYFFFCCTPQNQNTLSLTPSTVIKCFQVSICASITRSAIPPVILPGAQQAIYLQMTAEPLIDSLETRLEVYANDGSDVTIDFDVTTVGTSPFHNIIYTFEVPDIPQPGPIRLEFRADYTNNHVCTLAPIDEEADIIRESVDILSCPTANPVQPSTTQDPVDPLTTGVLVLATPSPLSTCSPASCPDTQKELFGTFHTIGVLVLGAVLVIVLVCVLIFAIIGWHRERKKRRYCCGNGSQPGSEVSSPSSETLPVTKGGFQNPSPYAVYAEVADMQPYAFCNGMSLNHPPVKYLPQQKGQTEVIV